jgi:hypothetical protein
MKSGNPNFLKDFLKKGFPLCRKNFLVSEGQTKRQSPVWVP